MSKVESFYWNKLCNKSFSFESEQFFDLCFVSAVQGVALITFYLCKTLLYSKTKGIFQEN